MLDDLEKGILKVSEEEAAIIKGEAKGDPLDLWLENYGPDAMEAIQEMEPALRRGTTPKDLLLTIEKNVDARPLTEAEKLELKANTREAGRVMQDFKDRVKGVSKEELKQKDPEMYDLLYGEGDPEEFAKGGRVGYQDGGPTKDEYGIMSLPSVPSNPDSVNDDIDRVAQLVAQSFKMGPEEQMNNKQIAYDRIEEIAEQISYGGNIDGVRSNLMDYFNDKVQEYQSMIQEFSTGGRVGYAYGSGLKLIQVLKEAGKSLKKEIKKAVDDLIPTGDPKLDADMAIDNMLEELGIDRDAIDGYDILDAYGLAYDELKRPLLKEIEETKSLAPKMTERFELKQKYPGIDDKLLTQIVDDPDPQRKAEVLATLDQAFELMRQGKSQEEVYDIMKQMTDRTKQASGGLNYLSGF
jgi:hypothetical protein